ncbi:MAG TPA: hypothetical protein VF808_18760 [Ktedonobacterales bacterium]
MKPSPMVGTTGTRANRAIAGSGVQRRSLALGLLLASVAWLAAGCGGPTGAGTNPTATPTPTCASVLPNSSAIDLRGHGFAYPITYPTNTVSSAINTTASGPGLFTVNEFTACTPGATVSSIQSFYNTQLPALEHGWYTSNLFPADGGLMTACSSPCFWNPKGGNIYHLVFDQFADHGSGVVTYRGRWAAFDISTLPACNANFNATNPVAQRMVYFVGSGDTAFPVPPLSSIVQDNASGGVSGYDICSPGDVVSVKTFLDKEVPAAGWTKAPASDPHCTVPANCWTKGGRFWSWNEVTDPTLWMMSYRQQL